MIAVQEIWHLSRDGAADEHELRVAVPVRTASETNMREHHMARHRRRAKIRSTVKLVVTGALGGAVVTSACRVVLTRIAPSQGLDSDNLVSSLKAARDGVADALGVDDRDARVMWLYDQRRGKRREWAVEVRILRGGTVK